MFTKTSLTILLSWLLAVTRAENFGALVSELKYKTNKKIKHGQEFNVEYVTGPGVALTWTYIAIYISKKNDLLTELPPDNQFHSWLNDCNTQEDCNYEPENAPLTGSVLFSLTPYSDSSDYEKYFPLNKGNYKACLIDEIWASEESETATYELIGTCDEFSVKPPKKKQIKKAVVATPQDSSPDATIEVEVTIPIRTFNTWVGLYLTSDLAFNNAGKVTGPLPAEELWGYTHCPLNTGNLDSGSCSNKKGKKKTIILDEKNIEDCEDCNWPLEKGSYVACLNFNSNSPYNKYKCSGKFQIK